MLARGALMRTRSYLAGLLGAEFITRYLQVSLVFVPIVILSFVVNFMLWPIIVASIAIFSVIQNPRRASKVLDAVLRWKGGKGGRE